MTPRALRLTLAAVDHVEDRAARVELTDADWWDAGCPWPRLHGLAVSTAHLESAVIATSGRRTPLRGTPVPVETLARSQNFLLLTPLTPPVILAHHQLQGAAHGRP